MEFNDFIDLEEEKVQQAALLLQEAKTELEAGNITRNQFDELVDDIMELEDIQVSADNINRKLAIQNAFAAFKMILGAIPK